MRLVAPDGQALELRVVDYQFPHLCDVEYDSNWLVIEGRVCHPRGNWTFRDPCLMVSEALSLADWLEAVAANPGGSRQISFTEPNLEFQFEEVEGGGPVLRVYFSLEARPPWAASWETGEYDLWVEFPAVAQELATAAALWRGELRAFPQRARR